jgi:hypothetical protein
MEVEASEGADPELLFMMVSARYEWQMTMNADGLFLCCPDCIETAYTEPGGKLGLLNDEYRAKMVPRSEDLSKHTP